MINLVVLVKQNKIDIKTVFIFIFMRLRKLKKRWLIYRPPGINGLRMEDKKAVRSGRTNSTISNVAKIDATSLTPEEIDDIM